MKVHYNNKNQLVARTHDDGILRKTVQNKEKHMRHKPPSWGFDVAIINDTNAHEIRILTKEDNMVYRTPMAKFVEKGFTQDIGAGEQTFLALEHWEVYPRGQKPEAHDFKADVEWFDKEL